MFPTSTLLAVCLLTSPTFPAQENKSFQETPRISLPTLRTAAIALEIMDERDGKWLFARPKDYESDLHLMRKRWEELRDAPPLCNAERFPSRDLCNTVLHFNRQYQAWLAERQQLFPGEEWIAEAINESEQLHTTWDTLRDSQCDYYYLHTRRKALKTLRERIGEWNYYAGCMPPPIPVWRIRRSD